jgi:hypothetical protein
MIENSKRPLMILTILFLCGCGSNPPARTWLAVSPPATTLIPTVHGAFSIVTTTTLPTSNLKESIAGVSYGMGKGGEFVPAIEAAPIGKQFLVLVFPATTAGFVYEKPKFSLLISGYQEVEPAWFTIGYGLTLPKGKVSHSAFEESFYDFYNIPITVPAGTPQQLAVAFEVPAAVGSGTVIVESIANPITWP